MKICRREIRFRVTVKIDRSIWMCNDDIVIYPEIGIIGILMFASDVHRTAVEEIGSGLPKAIKAPCWTRRENGRIMEALPGAVGAPSGTHQPLPYLGAYFFWICVTESGITPFFKQFWRDAEVLRIE